MTLRVAVDSVTSFYDFAEQHDDAFNRSKMTQRFQSGVDHEFLSILDEGRTYLLRHMRLLELDEPVIGKGR